MKKIFIWSFLFLWFSMIVYSDTGIMKNIKHIRKDYKENERIENKLNSIILEELSEYAEFQRVKNIFITKSVETKISEDEIIKFLEDFDLYKEEIEEKVKQLFADLSFKDQTSEEFEKLNRIIRKYPEIDEILIDNSELLIKYNKNINLYRNINNLKLDEEKYKADIKLINLDKYFIKFVDRQWQSFQKYYLTTKNYENYEKKVNFLQKVIYYYDYFLYKKKKAVLFDDEFKTGMKEYGKKKYNAAIKYFDNAKKINNEYFLHNGGNHWVGKSSMNLEEYYDSLKELKNSAVIEKDFYTKNAFNLIRFIFNIKIPVNKDNIEFVAEIYREIRDETPTIQHQMQAHSEIIYNYLYIGHDSNISEEKLKYYKLTVNEILEFIKRFKKEMQTVSYINQFISSIANEFIVEEFIEYNFTDSDIYYLADRFEIIYEFFKKNVYLYNSDPENYPLNFTNFMYLYNPLCEYLYIELYCKDYEKTFIEICDFNINMSEEYEIMRTHLYRGMYFFSTWKFEMAYKDFKKMQEISKDSWDKYKASYWIAFTLGALEWDEQIFLELPEIIKEFPNESETPIIKKEYASAQIRYGFKTNNIDLVRKGREFLEEILSKPNYMVNWFKDEFIFYIAKSYDFEYKITGNSALVEKAIEKYKEYFNVAEENYSYGYYDIALNNIAEIEIKAGNFDKASEYLKKALNRNGVIREFDYYEKNYDTLIEDIRANLEKCFSIQINPIIEDMKEGDHQLLIAELKDKYGNSLENGSYNIVEWKWRAVGSQDTEYELTVNEQNSDKATLYLKKGNFMDIIVTAECNFELLSENNRGDIFISKVIAIEGDNQVPIMIVNEDDRRIKNIPILKNENLITKKREEIYPEYYKTELGLSIEFMDIF
ncbi:MAG: hypothetical protein M0R46_12485, partial [Candidatus Muirbacterium halophilum]|nr:hypothetical protein [Candidatus Muirbacterium halophilum]